jgi:SMODS and SLOG-associating 2TM effector domain 2
MLSSLQDSTSPATQQAGKRRQAPKDIAAISFEALKWDTPQDRQVSIQNLYRYAEQHAQQSIDWYLGSKSSKSRWSRWLRLSAIALTTLGGLAPVILSFGWLDRDLGAGQGWSGSATAIIGQLGYLWLALAAACVATDRFFGFSSGWMRYIKTAQVLMKGLAEFRLDWAMLVAKQGGASPTDEQLQLMIQRIKEFVITVHGQVEQETLTWIAEFQTSLAEIEKTVRTQEEVSRPGAIDITVTNGMDAEEGFQVALDGMVVAHVRGTRHQIGYVAPGHHKIWVTGVIKGKKLDASELVNVPPGAIAKATLALPVEEAQP